MANSSGRRASSAAGKRGGKKSSGSGRKGKAPTYDYEKENELFHEIGLIIFFILMVILFLCNFGIIGPAGDLVSGVLFGLFGLTSYAVPVLLFVAVSFWYANSGNPNALRKLIAGAVLFLMVGVVCELFAQNSLSLEKYDMARIYDTARGDRTGGGVIGGSLAYLLHHYLAVVRHGCLRALITSRREPHPASGSLLPPPAPRHMPCPPSIIHIFSHLSNVQIFLMTFSFSWSTIPVSSYTGGVSLEKAERSH